MVFDSDSMQQHFPAGTFHQLTDQGLKLAVVPRALYNTDLRPADPHPHKTLSVLAMLGTPSASAFKVHGRDVALSEALRYCLWSFTLDDEVVWAVIAVALYAPNVGGWENKFGERFAFDDVCDFLMTSDTRGASCYGTHINFGVAALLNADSQTALLSPAVRRRAIARLNEVSGVLRRTQSSAGAWSAGWSDDVARCIAEPSRIEGMTVTAHTLEWLAAVPPEVKVDADMVLRGCDYLRDILLQESPAGFEGHFSAYTHALNALRMWFPNLWAKHIRPSTAATATSQT
ncbi:MAG TPA: hypothetical protein VNH11_23705 [Pirellulales bacterium]|nr:hypothetical protein [Pirellulales bacterium]